MTDIKMGKCEICECKNAQDNLEKRNGKLLCYSCREEFDRQVASNVWSKRYDKIKNLIEDNQMTDESKPLEGHSEKIRWHGCCPWCKRKLVLTSKMGKILSFDEGKKKINNELGKKGRSEKFMDVKS